jgi:hypothetical protein
MKKTIYLIPFLILNMSVEKVSADFTFGAPKNLGPTINSSFGEGPNCLSSDGLEFYFSSDSPGGSGSFDIWVARRDSAGQEWVTPVNLGQTVNSPREDALPCISEDGLSLLFYSNRPGGMGNHDIYITRRETINDNWNQPENLGPPVNTSGMEHAPRLSSDGLELYFGSYNRAGGHGASDIWVSKRTTVNDPWGTPMNLGAVVNSAADENFPFISANGLALFFSEDYGGPYRPGGLGDVDIWLATRASVNDP